MKQSKVQENFLSFVVQSFFKVLFSRYTFAIIALALQIMVIMLFVFFFNRYLIWFFGGEVVLRFLLLIYIINQPDNPSFQISWILLILLFPAFGGFIYLFVKLQIGVHALVKQYQKIRNKTLVYQKQNEKVYEKLAKENLLVANYVTYMNRISGYPIYQNTKTKYYPFGEDMFQDLLWDLKHAKKFIFLEYFILAKGFMWDAILDILKEKVALGVEVYLMYDGTCSFTLLPRDYPEELEKMGIHCRIFNPVVPIISTHYNNRDHRKIVVIDGLVGYTGGVNIGDEYINKIERFGIWKDTAIRVEGQAVQSFIILFLENWNATNLHPLSYSYYLDFVKSCRNQSFVLPFGDHPFDNYQVGEVTYFHMLQTAKCYVHIMTPYLILDYEMLNTLCDASRRGIDVKIIMPGIPDKKLIYYIAKTYYKTLLDAGVTIYEYTKGFVHAKMFISDDEKGVIGTINLDFRSLYLHFEDGVYLYHDSSVLKMEEDYQNTLKSCKQVTLSDLKNFSKINLFIGRILRVFAPLL